MLTGFGYFSFAYALCAVAALGVLAWKLRPDHGAGLFRLLPSLGCGALGLGYAVDLAARAGAGFGADGAAAASAGAQGWAWYAAPLAVGAIGGWALQSMRTRADAERAETEMRRRLTDFSTAASDWFWETDKDERFISFSEEVDGGGPNQRRRSIGKTREEISLPSLDPQAWAEYRAAVDARQPFKNFDYRRKVDVGERWVRISGVPAFDRSGAFIGYRGVGSDITDVKQAEAAAAEERERIAMVVEQLHEGFSLWDDQDRLVICNEEFRKINAAFDGPVESGVRFVDLLRANVSQSGEVVAEDVEAFVQARLAYRRNPDAPPMTIQMASGEEYLIQEQRLPDGYQVTLALNVTESRKAERNLREKEDLFQAVLDYSPSLITIRDREGRLVTANRTYHELFAGDLAGTTHADIYSADEADLLERHHRHVLETGEILTEEIGFERAEGRRTYLVVRFPITCGSSQLVGMVSTNISDRKEMETALIAAKERAEAANVAKSAFLARMSHELRTPLNAVIGFGQLMAAEGVGPLSEQYRSFADDIVQSGQYLLALVCDILDMAQIEAGELKLQPQACDVAAVASAASKMVQSAANGAIAAVRIDCAPDLPPVEADQRTLHQVFVNLVSNASKFTPAAGEIVIRATAPNAGEVRISVSDTGSGIDEADIERIFEPFCTNRPDQGVYEPNSGIGLGLSIVKGIVEAHGSALSVTSAPGDGACFSFSLPVARDADRLQLAS